jgi:hypothetical protein
VGYDVGSRPGPLFRAVRINQRHIVNHFDKRDASAIALIQTILFQRGQCGPDTRRAGSVSLPPFQNTYRRGLEMDTSGDHQNDGDTQYLRIHDAPANTEGGKDQAKGAAGQIIVIFPLADASPFLYEDPLPSKDNGMPRKPVVSSLTRRFIAQLIVVAITGTGMLLTYRDDDPFKITLIKGIIALAVAMLTALLIDRKYIRTK